MTIHLDTHVVVWLFYGEHNKIAPAARRAIERNEIVVSPACILEMELLHEIGRMRQTASNVVATLEADLGLRVCDLPFRTVVDHALREGWVRDPFDRLIVANASAANAPLVTKDERIRSHYSKAVW